MAKRTPQLYAVGRWVVKSPFKLTTNTTYSCQAIRSLEDLVARDIDPYTTYYQPVGITKATYEADKDNLPNIITLMSDTAPTVYIPDTYITSYPSLDIVPYRHSVLSVALGPIPDTLALDDITAKVEDLVVNNIGVESTAQIHQAESTSLGVTTMEHQILENARRIKITDNTTDRSKIQALEDQVTALQERNTFLEQLVIDEGLLS